MKNIKSIKYSELKVGQFFTFVEHCFKSDFFLKMEDGFVRIPNKDLGVDYWVKDKHDESGKEVIPITSKREVSTKIVVR